MLGVLAAFWLGRILAGDDESAFANGTGLLFAALVATSWWHVMLSRLGLRIVWTPLFVCGVAGFLAAGCARDDAVPSSSPVSCWASGCTPIRHFA